MVLSTAPKLDSRMRWCKHAQYARGNIADVDRMIFMFRSGTVQEKLKLILRATRTHAQNLSKYAMIYKATMLLLRYMGSEPGKEGPYDTFFAGLLGGYVVFGRRSKRGHISSVSKQIVIFGEHSPSRLFLLSNDLQCLHV
jgi:Tim17/Tim22/Tim23/Pmp24 family